MKVKIREINKRMLFESTSAMTISNELPWHHKWTRE
jgi:hypothetical protein